MMESHDSVQHFCPRVVHRACLSMFHCGESYHYFNIGSFHLSNGEDYKTSLTVPNKKVVPEFIANISFHVEHSFIIKVCGFGLNYESEVSCRGLIQQGLD